MAEQQFSQHHYGIWVPAGILAALVGIVLIVTLRGMKPSAQNDRVERAQALYQQKKAAGMTMENGPCLGMLENDWVVDIAHSPRQPVDDKPENQCAAFRDGTARHFIELTTNGDVIRQQ